MKKQEQSCSTDQLGTSSPPIQTSSDLDFQKAQLLIDPHDPTTLLSLDLKDLQNLITLPDGIQGLKALQTLNVIGFERLGLNLEGCESLQSLPDGIQHLMALGCSRLQSLPDGIQHLTALQTLNLQCCRRLKSLPDGIRHLTALQTLNLEWCASLQSLPDGIRHLTALQTLNLEQCGSLRSLPDGIQHLTALQTLNLEGCASLQSLPDGIPHLTALQTPNLMESCKRIQSLPDGIRHLTALQTLNLKGCGSLQSLPDGIQHLTALQTLNLEWCESLQSLPDGIQHLTALQTLNLKGCLSLQSLPDGIQHLTALQTLNLEWCGSLQSLPDGIQHLTALQTLNLRGCESLQSLPDGIRHLTALQTLNLEDCWSLQSLPDGIQHLNDVFLKDEGTSKVIIAGSSDDCPTPLDTKTTVICLSIIKEGYGEDKIVIGTTHNLLPCESLEFFFTKVDDMCSCVGVGLEHSKVQLGHDLDISIHQMDASEWESEAAHWRRIMADESSHRSMNVRGMIDEEGDDSLKSRCGLEVDCAGWRPRYVDETCNEGEVMWPVLFDIAAFVLADEETSCVNQCTNSVNDQNFTSRVDACDSSSQQAGSNTNSSGILNTIRTYLSNIMNRIKGNGDGEGDEDGNNRGGGDGDEEKGDSGADVVSSDADCKKLTVKVNARVQRHKKMEELTKRDASLQRAAIKPNLVFDFYKNGQNRRMVITFSCSFELKSNKSNDTLWCHDDHQILMSSEENPSDEEDTVTLEFASHKIINEQVECKSTFESNTTNKTGSGQELAGSLRAGVPSLMSMTVSTKSAPPKEATTSNTHHRDQMPYQRICNGFGFREHPTTEDPASFEIHLFKPADIRNVWDEETMEKCKGLITTIQPQAQATWLPRGLSERAPYFFKAKRNLTLMHKGGKQKGKSKLPFMGGRRIRLEQEEEEEEESWPEEYELYFKINEAMTHLQNKSRDVDFPKEKDVAGVISISFRKDPPHMAEEREREVEYKIYQIF